MSCLWVAIISQVTSMHESETKGYYRAILRGVVLSIISLFLILSVYRAIRVRLGLQVPQGLLDHLAPGGPQETWVETDPRATQESR